VPKSKQEEIMQLLLENGRKLLLSIRRREDANCVVITSMVVHLTFIILKERNLEYKQVTGILGIGDGKMSRRSVFWSAKTAITSCTKRKTTATSLCRKHPKYKAILYPRAACPICWMHYFIVHGFID
jgi:hypothetical protein